MIPIEKNIIVSDVNGRRIGATYPKRAKGLVKNGRAEFISDHEIRLLITQLPTVPIDTEDKKMSKVIQFDARAFGFDDSCETNVGYRGFITTENGNEEIWEIGDWNWNWTQLQSTIKGLERNTDYVFRFAMTLGHNDDDREESLVHIHYMGGDEKQAWDDRFTYCIGKSRFQPIISKRANGEDTMLRVFELPFNTGDFTDFRILIISQHAVSRLFRAADNAAYEGMEDLSYAQWRMDRTATLEAKALKQRMNVQVPAFHNMMPGPDMEDIVEDTVRDMVESALEEAKSEIDDMLEDRIEEAINDSISEINLKQKTKVLSPDKKKLLTCYGGLKVEDTSKWSGFGVPKGFGLSVQTRKSSWDLISVYETEKEATDALVAVNEAIESGKTLVEL